MDYVYSDTIFFRMDVPLGENEELETAVPDIFHQLTVICTAVYDFLRNFSDEADDQE